VSIHSDCGKEIRWVHRDDEPDRWHPPLEFDHQGYVIVDDVVIYTNIYKRHDCDPDDIKAWLDLKRNQAMAKGIDVEDIDAKEERIIAKEQQRDLYWAEALRVECPVCEAEVGQRCYNMSLWKKGIEEHTKNPHPKRLMDSWKADREE